MKKFDAVIVQKQTGQVKKGDSGIVIGIKNQWATVICFNQKNEGDYVIKEVEIKELNKIGEISPELAGELEIFLENIKFDEHTSYKRLDIKEYDKVQLTVDKEKYKTAGVYNGAVGCVVSEYAIKDSVMVDFSVVLPDGTIKGACIAVDVKDLIRTT